MFDVIDAARPLFALASSILAIVCFIQSFTNKNKESRFQWGIYFWFCLGIAIALFFMPEIIATLKT